MWTKIFCVIVALSNVAAILPIKYAHVNNKHVDFIALLVTALASVASHLAPAFFPHLNSELLWVDRVASIAAILHFAAQFFLVCPYDFERAYTSMSVVVGIGLVSLFTAEVLFRGSYSFFWCFFHCVWHGCAFLSARKMQYFIYRVQK
jgi:hypothetical protein